MSVECPYPFECITLLSAHCIPQLSMLGEKRIYSGKGCKTLWKESDTDQWVWEAHLCPITAKLKWVAENMLRFSVSKMLICCENVIKLFIRGKVWFLGHLTITLARAMLAYNQLLLFSQLLFSCSGHMSYLLTISWNKLMHAVRALTSV